MELSSDDVSKIKAAIKAKLVELGNYVDEELPDYIMILVANNKSQEQMNDDLNLFLRDNTVRFTEWLYVNLNRLKSQKESSSATSQAHTISKAVVTDRSGAAAVPSPDLERGSKRTVASGATADQRSAVKPPELRAVPALVAGEQQSSRTASPGLASADEVVSSSRRQAKRRHAGSDEPLAVTAGGSSRGSKVSRLDVASSTGQQATRAAPGYNLSAQQQTGATAAGVGKAAAMGEASSRQSSAIGLGAAAGSAVPIRSSERGGSAGLANTTSTCDVLTVKVEHDDELAAELDGDLLPMSSREADADSLASTVAASSRMRSAEHADRSASALTGSSTQHKTKLTEPVPTSRRATQGPLPASKSRQVKPNTDDGYGDGREQETRRHVSAHTLVHDGARDPHSSKRSPPAPQHTDATQRDARHRLPASSVGSVVRRNDSESDDEYDPYRPAVGSVASVVKVTERRSSVPKSLQANSALLLKAVKAAQVSVEARTGRRAAGAAARSAAVATAAGEGAAQPSGNMPNRATSNVRNRLGASGKSRLARAIRGGAASPQQQQAAALQPDGADSRSNSPHAEDAAPLHEPLRAPRGTSTPSSAPGGRFAAAMMDDPAVGNSRAAEVDAPAQAGATDLDLTVGHDELEELTVQPSDDVEAKAIAPSRARELASAPSVATAPPTARSQSHGRLSAKSRLSPADAAGGRLVQARAQNPRFIVTLDGVSEEELIRHVNVRGLESDAASAARSADLDLLEDDVMVEPPRLEEETDRLPQLRSALAARLRRSADLHESGRLRPAQRVAVRPPPGPAYTGRLQGRLTEVMATEDSEEPEPSGGDGVVAETTPSSLERCRYWPACKAGEACLYHHPSVPCRLFPDCKFGNQCLFVHPVCKFDALCKRSDCPYLHLAKRTAAGALPTPVAVAAAAAASAVGSGAPLLPTAVHAKKVNASSRHAARPPPAAVPPTCKFFPRCTNMNCTFAHPKPCRYGVGCLHKDTCTFSHPPLPIKSQLRWTAGPSSDDLAVLEALSS